MDYTLHREDIALEQLGRTLPYSEATEALGFIVKIFDVFMRLLNNFKTSLSVLRRNFKRSELRAYHESHVFAYKNFLNEKKFNSSLSIPIPFGMKVTYLQATTILEDLYKTLDIESTVKSLSLYFTNVSKTGQITPSEDLRLSINHLTRESTEKTLQQVFSNDRTLEVTLGSMFSSFQEILTVDQHILGYEAIFQRVEFICAELDKIEKIIDIVVTNLEKQNTPDKVQVQGLYQLVRTASIQLDMFGVILDMFQRIEHNFVIVLRRLVESSHS